MPWSVRVLIASGLACAGLGAAPVSAQQQVTIGVPQTTVHNGGWEHIGGQWGSTRWGTGWGGLSGPAVGGYNPNAGLSAGFALGSGARLNFLAGTGSSTTLTSTTPMLTVTEGLPGSMFVGRVVPFVTGFDPVFQPLPGLRPEFNSLGAANTLDGRWQRGEFHVQGRRIVVGPDPLWQPPPELAAGPPLFAPPVVMRKEAGPPVREIERDEEIQARAAEETAQSEARSPTTAQRRAEELWLKGQRLEAEGKPGAARLLYQTALRSASGELRATLEARLTELR